MYNRNLIRVLPAALVLLATVASANDIVIFNTTNEQGQTREYRLSEERAARLPVWSPASSKPAPLSVAEAVALAKQNVKASAQSDTAASSICLELSGEEHGGIWFYVVRLYDKSGGPEGTNPSLDEVIILLDGTILVPEISSNEPTPAKRPPLPPCKGARFFSEVAGKKFISCASSDILTATPSWDPNATPTPPLAPGAAIKAAHAAIAKLFPKDNTWQLSSVALQSVSGNSWYYLVTFLRYDKTRQFGFSIPQVNIPVLMNGSAVPTVPVDADQGQ